LEDETLAVLFFATGVLFFFVAVDLAAEALGLDAVAFVLEVTLFLAVTFGLGAAFLVDALGVFAVLVLVAVVVDFLFVVGILRFGL
jgi:hypothetical protein